VIHNVNEERRKSFPPSPAIPRLNYSTGEPIIFITIQFQSEKKKKKIFIHDAIPDILFTFFQSPYFFLFFRPSTYKPTRKKTKQNRIGGHLFYMMGRQSRNEKKTQKI
jgi:hypothetical protein